LTSKEKRMHRKAKEARTRKSDIENAKATASTVNNPALNQDK
jgi:hypothetical protein